VAKIPNYVRKLVGDDVALEDREAVAQALTLRLHPSPTTVRADDDQVGQCVWPYCSGYGETSIRKGHVVAEVNWSGGRAWVHAYHLKQLGVRFAPTEEDRRRQLEMDAQAVRRGFRPASEVLRICPWRSPQVVVVLIEAQRGNQLCWAQGVGEKRALLRLATENDRVLVGWPGEWRQDLFELTSEDRKAVLDMLGSG
jgi:hypothetical protein